VLHDAGVHVDAEGLRGGGLQGVPGVELDAAGGAALHFGVVVGPLVREVGVDLDGGRVPRVDGGPERPCGVEGLAAQDLAAGGLRAAELGEFGGVGLFDAVVRFALGDDLGLVLGQLVGREVAAVLGGAGEDFVGGGAGRLPLLDELVA
jgi:hypothetical protein